MMVWWYVIIGNRVYVFAVILKDIQFVYNHRPMSA